jgi:hypothetical protein
MLLLKDWNKVTETRYKHLAPTVLVSPLILTVSPDLQQHAASDAEGMVPLFLI